MVVSQQKAKQQILFWIIADLLILCSRLKQPLLFLTLYVCLFLSAMQEETIWIFVKQIKYQIVIKKKIKTSRTKFKKKNTPHFHFDMENFTLAHKTLVYVSFDPYYYYYYKNLYFNSKFHLFYVLDPKMLRNERKSHKKTLSRKKYRFIKLFGFTFFLNSS